MTSKFHISTYLLLFVLALSFSASGCKTYYQAATTENLSRPVNAEIDTEGSTTASEVAKTIAPYKAQLSEIMDEPIGRLTIALEKGRPESRLGNWIADLLQQAGQDLFTDKEIDFAVQNYGGIRINELAAGNITVRDIYSVMPFDNELVAVEMNGFVLNEFINHMATDGGWPISKELRFRIEDKKAVDISIKGEPIAFNRNYIVALPDYVANGGSDCEMLSDRQQYKSGKKIRDLLIDYTRNTKGVIQVELDKRITQ